jgi:ferrous iron transport protein A
MGGEMLTKRLADLGITPGKELKLIRKTLFSGPVQVEVAGSKLVIGWGLASKIMVEVK